MPKEEANMDMAALILAVEKTQKRSDGLTIAAFRKLWLNRQELTAKDSPLSRRRFIQSFLSTSPIQITLCSNFSNSWGSAIQDLRVLSHIGERLGRRVVVERLPYTMAHCRNSAMRQFCSGLYEIIEVQKTLYVALLTGVSYSASRLGLGMLNVYFRAFSIVKWH